MSIGLLERAAQHGDRIAIYDRLGPHVYADLCGAAGSVARRLLAGRADLEETRVAYLLPPGFDYVAAQWGIWSAGGVAVPLATSHPAPELGMILDDARPTHLLVEEALLERAEAAVAAAATLAREAGRAASDPPVDVVSISRLDQAVNGSRGRRSAAAAAIDGERAALMIYTSGTTGRPKGVVTTHANLEAQISVLVDAWAWSGSDTILHVLPLHHVHGIVNALCCSVWAGATCRFCRPDPLPIWEGMATADATVFMAVPTIYRRLLSAWEEADDGIRRRWAAGAAGLRLMVSGSAALPVDTFRRWQQVTGHALLERYGMTEIGMALANPLHGERRPGTVGQPLAGVEARLVGEAGAVVDDEGQGEIQVRGAQVFREYWGRPHETEAAFTEDGWFRTGDDAVIADGYWRIIGRRSVDIIKSGGYKVSALEIETIVQQHPSVVDVAVVGVADDEWGERVCAAVVVRSGSPTSADDLRAWCREQMAPYRVPKQLVLVDDLPRNAMGKVLKPQLRRVFTDAAD